MARTGRPKKSVEVRCACQKCGREFFIREWAHRAGRGKFCSRACYETPGKHRKRPSFIVAPEIKECEVCGKKFEVGGAGRPKRGQRFCSMSCATNAKYRWGILKGGSKKGRLVNHDAGYFEHLRPAQSTTTWDIAWAAGVYEGEGWCGKGNTQMIGVGQKDRWLCDRLRSLFGGRVNERKRIGGSGPYADRHGGFIWNVSGPRARGFLMTIHKFLSPRRREQMKNAMR